MSNYYVVGLTDRQTDLGVLSYIALRSAVLCCSASAAVLSSCCALLCSQGTGIFGANLEAQGMNQMGGHAPALNRPSVGKSPSRRHL